MRNASSGSEAAIILVGKYQVRIGCELLFASPPVQAYVLLLQRKLINSLRRWRSQLQIFIILCVRFRGLIVDRSNTRAGLVDEHCFAWTLTPTCS